MSLKREQWKLQKLTSSRLSLKRQIKCCVQRAIHRSQLHKQGYQELRPNRTFRTEGDFNHLKLHLVVLCEQPEAEKIYKSSFTSPGFVETLNNYFITGYANDSNDGVPGITIMGGKLLQSGKIVDLKIFTPFGDEEYKFSEELQIDAAACDAEVEAYLFEEKWGIKQERLDFDSDIPDEAVTDAEELPAEEEKPKRKGRKTKTIAPAA